MMLCNCLKLTFISRFYILLNRNCNYWTSHAFLCFFYNFLRQVKNRSLELFLSATLSRGHLSPSYSFGLFLLYLPMFILLFFDFHWYATFSLPIYSKSRLLVDVLNYFLRTLIALIISISHHLIWILTLG